MPVQVFGLGTVEARVTSKVGFKVAGVLIDLHADVGDRVGKGAVLARLDDREQSARVARAKAATEQAEANLQQAMANVQKAQANFANAKSINERRQKLVQSNTASVETAETAKTAQDARSADAIWRQAMSRWRSAAIGDAKAQLQQETATLDFHTLDGALRRHGDGAAEGARFGARRRRAGVHADRSEIGLGARLYRREQSRRDQGRRAGRNRPALAIRISGLPGRSPASSRRATASTRSGGSRSRSIRLPADFHLGEQAEVYITTVHLPQALLVPEAAIVGLGKDGGTVWTVEDGHLQQRAVTLGHRLLDGRYEITGGVPDKAQVVAQLRSGLRAGRAAIVEAKATQGAKP